MKRELLSKAVGDIDTGFIEEAYRPVREEVSVSSEIGIKLKKKRIVTLALAAALLLSAGITVFAVKPTVRGWGGNFEITDTGSGLEPVLHTDRLTDPVSEEDGRLWFIVNDEHIDITDLISETKPFLYSYTDEEGVVHYWIVGKNGPELSHWGYGEYLYKPEENWIRGYTARTDLDPDREEPLWLRAGKEQLGISR